MTVETARRIAPKLPSALALQVAAGLDEALREGWPEMNAEERACDVCGMLATMSLEDAVWAAYGLEEETTC